MYVDRKIALIVAPYRSGSTIFANTFNRDDAFYLFEPLLTIENSNFTNSLLEEHSLTPKILSNFYNNCTIPTIVFPSPNTRRNCKSGICFHFNVNRFCSHDYCDSLNDAKTCKSVHSCKINLVQATNDCSKQRFRVIKAIRAISKNTLINLYRQLPDLIIIHLVRDPRALFYSRLKLKDNDLGEQELREIASHECQQIIEKFQSLRNLPIRFIKYEDFDDQIPLLQHELSNVHRNRRSMNSYSIRQRHGYKDRSWKNMLSTENIAFINRESRSFCEKIM